MFKSRWLAFILGVLSLSAQAASVGVVTLADPGTLFLRGATFYKASPGSPIDDGDILFAAAKGQVQVELTTGVVAALAGPGTLWIQTPKAGAPLLTLSTGALKAEVKPPGLRLRTAAFDADVAEGVIVVRAELAAADLFVESGRARLVNPTSPPHDAKRGEFWQKSLSTAFASRPLPPRAFVDALPRNFMDPLPVLAAALKSRPAPVADHDITYPEAQAWLALDRAAFERRFVSRLRDPVFRKAVEPDSARYPSWDRILHPEKYKPKPPPEK